MPSNQNRIDRISEEMMRELSGLLRQVKDPRVAGPMLSIVRCNVTNDLRWCKVHLSVLGSYDEKELMRGLRSCSGFLRSQLARALQLRYTPELSFVLDDSIAYGAHITKVLEDLHRAAPAREEDGAPTSEQQGEEGDDA